jgi:hypothetical protein
MNKYFSKAHIALLLFSSSAFPQSRSGRGEDWYDDYSGDGGYFFYFLIAFWGFVFAAVLLRLIYEAILENGKRWVKSFLDGLYFFLKTFLMISVLFGVILLGTYLFVESGIKIPQYMDYVGRLIVCVFWLGIIKYLFFDDKTKDEIISFFKTPKGIVVCIFILLLIIAFIFG